MTRDSLHGTPLGHSVERRAHEDKMSEAFESMTKEQLHERIRQGDTVAEKYLALYKKYEKMDPTALKDLAINEGNEQAWFVLKERRRADMMDDRDVQGSIGYTS